jgi:glutamine transport system substrate-binding protein
MNQTRGVAMLISRRFLLSLCAGAALGSSIMAQQARAADLVVGSDTSFKPFEFSQNGTYVGFDIDLWAEVSKDLGLKYEIKSMDFGGLIPALQTKNIDVALAGITIKDSRKQAIDFSDPYYASGLTALVKAGDTRITKVADLKGKTVGAKAGTATIDFLKKEYPDIVISAFPNIDNALLELQAGRVDAVIHDTPEMVYYAGTVGKGAVSVLAEPIKSGDFYGIGFPKGSDLVPKVNEALKKIKTDGRYVAIYKKWFGIEPTAIP